MRHHRLLGLAPCIACVIVTIVNLLHLLLHGTPLDGGALDSGIAFLNTWAMGLTTAPVLTDD